MLEYGTPSICFEGPGGLQEYNSRLTAHRWHLGFVVVKGLVEVVDALYTGRESYTILTLAGY